MDPPVDARVQKAPQNRFMPVLWGLWATVGIGSEVVFLHRVIERQGRV